VKASSHFPGVRPGASRRFAASGPGLTGTNREGIRVRLYSPGSATDQSRFGAKIGIAPDAQRCVPVRPDTPRFSPGIGGRAPVPLRRVTIVGRQSPGVSR